MTACDPKPPPQQIALRCLQLTYIFELTTLFVRVESGAGKGKSSESWRRKATGPRFLREAMDDSPKDPKIAGLPITNPVHQGEIHEEDNATTVDYCSVFRNHGGTCIRRQTNEFPDHAGPY